jgi:hypothetical protein
MESATDGAGDRPGQRADNSAGAGSNEPGGQAYAAGGKRILSPHSGVEETDGTAASCTGHHHARQRLGCQTERRRTHGGLCDASSGRNAAAEFSSRVKDGVLLVEGLVHLVLRVERLMIALAQGSLELVLFIEEGIERVRQRGVGRSIGLFRRPPTIGVPRANARPVPLTSPGASLRSLFLGSSGDGAPFRGALVCRDCAPVSRTCIAVTSGAGHMLL